MLACVDVDYRADHAMAACLVFRAWADSAPTAAHTVRVAPIAPYVPGQFYKRELPCVLEVLRQVADPIEMVLIDRYVWLDEKGTPGLGAHLYDSLGRNTPVVGVAKTHYATAAAQEILRPGSVRPLYVTAAGVEPATVAGLVRSMHGAHRIPTLLKQVDTLCRQA